MLPTNLFEAKGHPPYPLIAESKRLQPFLNAISILVLHSSLRE